MKTTLSILLSIALLTFTYCGKDDGGSSGSETFIPDLSAQWTNNADAANHFFFPDAPSNVNTGSFTGNENPGSGSQIHFSGSFTNHNIHFTYDSTAGSKRGKSYNGTINNASTVITLTSSTLGSLVLEKK